MARWASFIRARRSEKPAMLLDAGDFCLTTRGRKQNVRSRFFFEAVKLLGYDALAVGERDLKYGYRNLLETADDFDLTLISSNIIDKRNKKPVASPYTIEKLGGYRTLFGRRGSVKVGIFSVILPVFLKTDDGSQSIRFKVENPSMTAMEMVSELRGKGCHLVIAISHQGWKKSLKLARSVPGIDIVINSHRSHKKTHQELIGGTLVVDPGEKRNTFTEINVAFEADSTFLKASDVFDEVSSMPDDPDVIALEKLCEDELRKLQLERSGGG